MTGTEEIRWHAPEHLMREKTAGWYWVSIMIASVMIAFAVWQKNFLFGIFVVIAELLVITLGGREARLLEFSLSGRGLTIGTKTFYPYTEFALFGMDEDLDSDAVWYDIVLRFRHGLRPALRLHVPHTIVVKVRTALQKKLPYAPWRPSLIEVLQEFIGL